jgi:iron(II)-dependent oxidoreductase
LPTEAEWEVAATWDPASRRQLAYPWGNEPLSRALANVDQLAFETAPVGAYRRNVSPIGCYGMIGDLWEWTRSELEAAPDVKVLRGGSWATRPGAIRASVRKAAPPGARHVFAGFRCAHDA